jgi:transposase
MDTSVEVSATDTLGRSVPPRRYRTMEEKRRIVEETLARGASVAVIARRHEVNANLVFGWRKLYQKGLLGAAPRVPATPLLPVRLTGSRALAKRRRDADKPVRRARGPGEKATVEIELAGGGRVRVSGEVASSLLERLIDALCRR